MTSDSLYLLKVIAGLLAWGWVCFHAGELYTEHRRITAEYDARDQWHTERGEF